MSTLTHIQETRDALKDIHWMLESLSNIDDLQGYGGGYEQSVISGQPY
jgi:hypothetical protein